MNSLDTHLIVFYGNRLMVLTVVGISLQRSQRYNFHATVFQVAVVHRNPGGVGFRRFQPPVGAVLVPGDVVLEGAEAEHAEVGVARADGGSIGCRLSLHRAAVAAYVPALPRREAVAHFSFARACRARPVALRV